MPGTIDDILTVIFNQILTIQKMTEEAKQKDEMIKTLTEELKKLKEGKT